MNTFLTSVKASRASGPSSRPSPDCLNPPNGVQYRTDECELTDRLPVSTARATLIARPTLPVQIEPDSPYGVSFAIAIASASSLNLVTVTTGPNTSSVYAGASSAIGASTVGGNQYPGPAGALPRNATGASSGTYFATFARWAAEIKGPISVWSDAGSPTRTPVIAGSSSAMNRSNTESCTRILDRAQQSWPALSNTAYGAVAAARSISESAKTMLALLPPSSSVSRFTCLAQPAMICLPTSVEPVNTILRTAGWSTRRWPTTDPLPGSTWNTCSGSPAANASSPIRIAVSGVSSAGLATTAHPAASAGARPQDRIGMGKFHGTIRPTTPTGSLKVTSRPPGTGICRPAMRSGAAE